jgi:hypothetical protein
LWERFAAVLATDRSMMKAGAVATPFRERGYGLTRRPARTVRDTGVYAVVDGRSRTCRRARDRATTVWRGPGQFLAPQGIFDGRYAAGLGGAVP